MGEPKIIFEDNDVLVLDKPAGMIVNRSDTTRGEKTVQEWVEEKFRIKNHELRIKDSDKLSKDEDSETDYTSPNYYEKVFYERAGIVHRLDKETSGILIVAKTPKSFENLQKQFKERIVKKTYVALVHGEVKPKEGEIKAAVGRLPWNRMRFGVLSGGREAVTKYKVVCSMYYVSGNSKEPVSLLELYPQTGRTHQIRVHVKYINHPIFADFLYAGRKTARSDRTILSRVFLHAAKISFAHPATGEQIALESPLPLELQKFLDSYCENRSF